MTTLEFDPDDVTAAITALTSVRTADDFNTELPLAADFVATFGTFDDLFTEPELSKAQFWFGPAGAAWGMLGHWSVQRGDGTSAKDRFEHADDCQICGYLESVAGLLDMFDHEPCEECGGGLDAHDVSPDQLGNPHAWCRNMWIREEPFVGDANPGPEDRLDDVPAFDCRWIAQLSDGSYAIVTRTFYMADEYDADGNPTGNDVHVIRVDAYQVSVDPANAADTEIDATYRSERIDDPQTLDLRELALHASEPEPGEWHQYAPEHFRDMLVAAPGPARV